MDDKQPEVNASVNEPEVPDVAVAEPLTPEEQEAQRRAADPYVLGADADRTRLVAQTRLFTDYIRRNAIPFVGKDPKRILDIGCGEGQLTRIFAEIYPKAQVIGIDKNEKAIEAGRETIKAKNVKNLTLEVGDIQEALPAGPFDIVYGSAILVHVPDTEKVVKLVFDVLAPEGKFWSKEPDYLVGIPRPEYMEPIKLLYGTIGMRGGHPEIVRELTAVLHKTGFNPIHDEMEYYPLGNTSFNGRIAFSLFAGAIYNARAFIAKMHNIPEDAVLKMYHDACEKLMAPGAPSGRLLLVNRIATRPRASA